MLLVLRLVYYYYYYWYIVVFTIIDCHYDPRPEEAVDVPELRPGPPTTRLLLSISVMFITKYEYCYLLDMYSCITSYECYHYYNYYY